MIILLFALHMGLHGRLKGAENDGDRRRSEIYLGRSVDMHPNRLYSIKHNKVGFKVSLILPTSSLRQLEHQAVPPTDSSKSTLFIG